MLQRRGIVIAVVVLLAAVVPAIVISRSGDDDEPGPARLTATWDESEGDPACVYDAGSRSVEVKVVIDGEVPGDPVRMTVTVAAYADENTSREVGSATDSVQVEGTVHERMLLTFPVERAVHIDEDGVAACRISSTY